MQQLGAGGALSARRRPYRIKDRRIKRIKEKLQSGDYSLDAYVFKLYEQVDGVQKLTVIQLASLFQCNCILISVITLSLRLDLQVSGQLVEKMGPNGSRPNWIKFGVDQMGVDHNGR